MSTAAPHVLHMLGLWRVVVLKIVARGRDAVEWRPKRGQNRSFCEVKKLINLILIFHARNEGSSDRGGALKPPPMGLGSYWALVDTNKTRFDRCFKKSIFGQRIVMEVSMCG